MKFWAYYFQMKTKISADFEICTSGRVSSVTR